MLLLKKITDYLLLLINIVAIICLLLSYLSYYIPPSTNVFFAFFGLAYPVFFIINIVLIIYWLIRKSKIYLISFIVIIIGYNQLFNFFTIPITLDKVESSNSIKIMSYNVRLFDLYDWTREKGVKDKIIKIIIENSPDIVCFQEYYSKEQDNNISKKLNTPYKHQYFTKNTSILKRGGIGTAIFSKYKIINKGEILFEGNNSNHSIFIDVLKGKDTIRIYNAHLGSIRLDYDDYNYIKRNNKQNNKGEILPLKKLIKRLDKSFKQREKQVIKLKKHIQKTTYPVILATDMNDTPISYTYKQLSNMLSDSFKKNGSFVGSTYIGEIPLLRIDYLWYNNKIENIMYKTINKKLSDHKPIIGEYIIKK